LGRRFAACLSSWTWVRVAAVCFAFLLSRAQAQNRGVYPLGMSALNSGVTPAPGFTYSNQLIYYSRDQAKNNDGSTLPVTGNNSVLMDMNSFVWVSKWTILGSANYSAIATLPVAKNDLTSDINGNISGGKGFADSYYVPFILGWNKKRVAVRAMYGFLAPTGRFAPSASDNVGSGYWTNALSSGQTFYLKANKTLVLSAFQMYEFHTTQSGTGIHPGETLDLDYSLMAGLPAPQVLRLQIGLAGYDAWQTTTRTGPTISELETEDRYKIHSLGFAVNSAFPKHKAAFGVKYFKEFANRSTFQGYSLQASGSIAF
jgi:hypothetical protein